MLEKINEKVDVITIYKRLGTKVLPYKVRWNGRDYIVTKIGYHHKIREGRTVHHIFSVSTGTLALRLNFDTELLSWTLEEVSDGSPS